MTEIADIGLARPERAVQMALMARRYVEHGLPWTWTPSRIRKHVYAPDSLVIAATRDRQLLGFSVMIFFERRAHLSLLGVEPRFRRQGVGTALIRWLELTAQTAGTFAVNLEVRATNMAALKFYERLGYSATKRIPGYYRQLEDAIRMRRDLQVA